MQDELIELKLRKSGLEENEMSEALIGIVDRLLAMISDVAIGNESLKTSPEFRQELNEFRTQVNVLRPDGVRSVQSLAESCLSACEKFFRHAREHALNREIEFIEIIDVLRTVVRTLSGDSEQFSQSVMGSSRRFKHLLELNDLQVLKQQIVVEAQDLDAMVVEQQKNQKESYSALSSKIETLQQRLARAEEDAQIDALTQVGNRGSFDDAMANWTETHRRAGTRFILAMLDLDDFKKINDTMGHQVGDRVLLGAAQTFKKCVRSDDLVARYGGEEFAVLLGDISLDQAEVKFTAMLEEIASTRYELRKGDTNDSVRYTVSCGVAEFDGSDTAEQIIRRADEALYDAKKRGKNRVIVKKKSLLTSFFSKKRNNAA
jgi:diguanylate cyclase (GGDEF)-like protein